MQAPAYGRAADMILEEFPHTRLTLAKFDATSDEALGKQFGVSGYPTLVLFLEDGD